MTYPHISPFGTPGSSDNQVQSKVKFQKQTVIVWYHLRGRKNLLTFFWKICLLGEGSLSEMRKLFRSINQGGGYFSIGACCQFHGFTIVNIFRNLYLGTGW